MTHSVRRRAAALALAVSVPAGIGTLVADTTLLATTADGGQPVILPPGYPKPPVFKTVPTVGPTTTVPDPVLTTD